MQTATTFAIFVKLRARNRVAYEGFGNAAQCEFFVAVGDPLPLRVNV
jgi:hypothetical protein